MEVLPSALLEEKRNSAIRDARIRLSGLYELENVKPKHKSYVEAWRIRVGLPLAETLLIQIPESYPFELPHIYLENGDLFREISHLNRAGRFCYIDTSAIAYDVDNMANVVAEAVQQSVDGLRDEQLLRSEDEFRKELFAYLPSSGKFLSLLSDLGQPHAISVLKFEEPTPGKFHFLVADTAKEGEVWLENASFAKPRSVECGFFIPQAFGGRPPFPATLGEMLQMMAELEGGKLALWLSKMRKSPLIVSTVRSSLGDTILAWEHLPSRFSDSKSAPKVPGFRPGKYPVKAEILATRTDEPLSFYGGERVDLDRLVRRTDPTLAVADARKVVLVGAGSVGSHLIESIVSSTICDSVAIFDPDTLGAENVLRHTAKFWAIGFQKAIIVGIALQRKCPWMEVKTHFSAIDQLEEFLREVREADLIVLATGSEAVDGLLASEAFKVAKIGTVVAQAWLESEAVRGHLTCHVKGQEGCPSCCPIKRPTTDINNLIREPGCGGAFANYGGSRLGRYVATAADYILSVDRPLDLVWHARADSLESVDRIEMVAALPTTCSHCS